MPSMPFTPCQHPETPIDTYQCQASINAQSQCTFVCGHFCLSWLVKNVLLVLHTYLSHLAIKHHIVAKCAKVCKTVTKCDAIWKK